MKLPPGPGRGNGASSCSQRCSCLASRHPEVFFPSHHQRCSCLALRVAVGFFGVVWEASFFLKKKEEKYCDGTRLKSVLLGVISGETKKRSRK